MRSNGPRYRQNGAVGMGHHHPRGHARKNVKAPTRRPHAYQTSRLPTGYRPSSNRRSKAAPSAISNAAEAARRQAAARRGAAKAERKRISPRSAVLAPKHPVTKKKALTIGKFRVGKTIGQGTFGKVKLGTHLETGEKVAIKILLKSKIVEVADVERVSREILILKRVAVSGHANVIRLVQVIDTPDAIYLIMEYCPGGELFDYIVKHSRVKEQQACIFFRQIISGVDFLHKNHVVHRDLKPENLLMLRRPEGWQIKVVDFGLSNTDEGNKLLKTACGSPCYAAPEMIAGKKYSGPLADMWSLGVVLFALVCGYLPFEDDNTAKLYKKILRGEYKCPKFISPQVRDLIGRILETNPDKRYTIEHVRRHPWFRMVEENPHSKMPVLLHHVPAHGEENAKLEKLLKTLDKDVLKQVIDLGFNPQKVVEDFLSKKQTQATKAYGMLLQRKQKLLSGTLSKPPAAKPKPAAPKPAAATVQKVAATAATAATTTAATTTAAATAAATANAAVATAAASATTKTTVPDATADVTTSSTTTADPTKATKDGTKPTAPVADAAAHAVATGRKMTVSKTKRADLPQKPHRPGQPSSDKSAMARPQRGPRNLEAVSLQPIGTAEVTSNTDGQGKAPTPHNSAEQQELQIQEAAAATTGGTTGISGTSPAWPTPRSEESAPRGKEAVAGQQPEPLRDHHLALLATQRRVSHFPIAAGQSPKEDRYVRQEEHHPCQRN